VSPTAQAYRRFIRDLADAAYLDEFRKNMRRSDPQADIVVASCHWGLGREPLQYMTDIAHAAIDAGADVVMGPWPHYSLPVEVYNGRPIFYGLSNLTFSTGHLGRRHAGWIGMLVEVTFERGTVAGYHFRFVRSNDNNESFLCRLSTRPRHSRILLREAASSVPVSSPKAIACGSRQIKLVGKRHANSS